MPVLDAICLDSPEALLLDGANGVCGEARAGAGRAEWLHVGATLVAAVAIAAWLSSRRVPSAIRAPGIVLVALVAAFPGIWALIALRADRPSALRDTARDTIVLHDRMRTFAVDHGCAEARWASCDACMPAARLALAGLQCDAPATIVLGEGALDAHCEERGRSLVCGRAR
ncbi:hypothetical protein [Sandaracinus amylolyticus]|uniref:hypothetical protein n=1 Tax=Sandaracinus amylolyticus TaxID=927083 RepID=UPI001F410D60|nr:hypothetical protein [Sandaracinus amylolyticus]UJR82714.1 Hypothetical protein I5071_47790 [Sandaracinus amylolyticus]